MSFANGIAKVKEEPNNSQRKQRKRESLDKLSWNTNDLRVDQSYFTRVSEKLKERVTEMLSSQGFHKLQCQTLGALLKMGMSLLNSQVFARYGTVPESSWTFGTKNLECNESNYQKYPQLGAFSSVNSSSHSVISDQVHRREFSQKRNLLIQFCIKKSNLQIRINRTFNIELS